MKEKMFKATSFRRVLSTLLIAVMVLTMLPVNAANAADNSATYGKSVSFNGADGKTVSTNIVPAKLKFDVNNLAEFKGLYSKGYAFKFEGDKAAVKPMKKIASISKKGILKGKKDGVVTISLYDSSKKDAKKLASAQIFVTKVTFKNVKKSPMFIPGSFSISDNVLEPVVSENKLSISQNALLNLILASDDFTISYKENTKSKVATVNRDGIVTINSNGKSGSVKVQMIIANKADAKKTVKISTTIKVKLPKLSKKSIKLNAAKPEKTKTLKVKNIVDDKVQTITWVSADPTIASVDKDGVVKPLKSGETNVSAVINGTAYSCKVNVK